MIDKPVKICFEHFPLSFGGVVIAQPDFYLMILNDDLPKERLLYVFNHEMAHIALRHLTIKNKKTRKEKEMEADALAWGFNGVHSINIIIPPN